MYTVGIRIKNSQVVFTHIINKWSKIKTFLKLMKLMFFDKPCK